MALPRFDDDRRGAKNVVDTRFAPLNVHHIVERELFDVMAGYANDAEVGEQVALAGHARREPPRTAAPQQSFPWQRNLGHHRATCAYDGLPKLTFGTSFAPSGTW